WYVRRALVLDDDITRPPLQDPRPAPGRSCADHAPIRRGYGEHQGHGEGRKPVVVRAAVRPGARGDGAAEVERRRVLGVTLPGTCVAERRDEVPRFAGITGPWSELV